MTENLYDEYGFHIEDDYCDDCGGYLGDWYCHGCNGHPFAICQEGRCHHCNYLIDQDFHCDCEET